MELAASLPNQSVRDIKVRRLVRRRMGSTVEAFLLCVALCELGRWGEDERIREGESKPLYMAVAVKNIE